MLCTSSMLSHVYLAEMQNKLKKKKKKKKLIRLVFFSDSVQCGRARALGRSI